MGMSGDTALALAKSYVKKTLQGQGALKGQDGFSPIIEENADNTDKVYKLDITTADYTFTTPNLRGKDGEGGTGGGEENNIDSISVNGVNVAPDAPGILPRLIILPSKRVIVILSFSSTSKLLMPQLA